MKDQRVVAVLVLRSANARRSRRVLAVARVEAYLKKTRVVTVAGRWDVKSRRGSGKFPAQIRASRSFSRKDGTPIPFSVYSMTSWWLARLEVVSPTSPKAAKEKSR